MSEKNNKIADRKETLQRKIGKNLIFLTYSFYYKDDMVYRVMVYLWELHAYFYLEFFF